MIGSSFRPQFHDAKYWVEIHAWGDSKYLDCFVPFPPFLYSYEMLKTDPYLKKKISTKIRILIFILQQNASEYFWKYFDFYEFQWMGWPNFP